MQLKPELGHPLPQGGQELLRLVAMPESNNEVVRVAHDDDSSTYDSFIHYTSPVYPGHTGDDAMIATRGTQAKITLLPQEREGACRFDGRFVATQAAHELFGPAVVRAALGEVKKQVAVRGGMDYFQVLDIDGRRLWIIDDGEIVTALLPEDY